MDANRLLALALCVAAVASTGCSSTDSFSKVDLKIENAPPLPATVKGESVTLPEGIGIAVSVTPYANGSVDDTLAVEINSVSSATVFDMEPGAGGVNEFFLTGLMPGSGSVTLGLPPSATDKAGNQIDGTRTVQITVTPQM